jgi:plastin-3
MERNGSKSPSPAPAPAKISEEERAEILEVFQAIDKDRSGFIDSSELKEALDAVGLKLPGWQIRQMIQEYDSPSASHRGKLSVDEFENLCRTLKMKDVAKTFKQVVSKNETLQTIGGLSYASSE